MVAFLTVMGSGLGVLVAAATVAAGFGWWIAILAYLGSCTVGMATGIVISLLRNRETEADAPDPDRR